MMFCRDEGSGRVVLLVHGLGASSRVFDALFSARPVGVRLLAIDLPRTGRSQHWAATQPLAIAHELQRLMDTKGLARFGVFGHSFGGLIALALAERIPERIEGLALASVPALGLPAGLTWLVEHPLAETSMGWFGGLPVFRPAIKTYLEFIWGKRRPLEPARVRLYGDAAEAVGFQSGVLEGLRAIAKFRLNAPAFQAAQYPRRVLWGERDPLVSTVDGERLARAIGATLEVLHDVGHCVPEEAADAVMAAIDFGT